MENSLAMRTNRTFDTGVLAASFARLLARRSTHKLGLGMAHNRHFTLAATLDDLWRPLRNL